MKPFFMTPSLRQISYITIAHFRSNNPATATTMTITTMIPSQVLLNILPAIQNILNSPPSGIFFLHVIY